MFTTSFRFTEKDFVQANLALLYQKKSMKFLTILLSIFFLISLLGAILVPEFNSPGQGFIFLVVSMALPILTYFSARKNYRTNQRLTETIEYQFADEYFSVKGDSFSSQVTWNKVFKVTQSKHWIFIWQNRQIANTIPKRIISDTQMTEFKEILRDQRVKNSL